MGRLAVGHTASSSHNSHNTHQSQSIVRTYRLIWRYFSGVRELEDANTQTFICLVVYAGVLGWAQTNESARRPQQLGSRRGKETADLFWCM